MNEERENKIETVKYQPANAEVVCPLCGAATVQEKCKVICKSDVCRGRVIYNCAEF